ncbi:uncharacterized protein LOC127239378 [Andrographis paniculata]|uniref:uncharacterized protein LOC127239378 n=1 Tax=Andrographis paniculata TaxID=175694 RepID=UPI0021E834D7|nr:uncharacterized protein LOC127239378 [Andrographis paniculata]
MLLHRRVPSIVAPTPRDRHLIPTVISRCPNCGYSPIENPKSLDNAPFFGLYSGDGDSVIFFGEKLGACEDNGGWVSDAEEPFDLDVSPLICETTPATVPRPRSSPVKDEGLEGGVGVPTKVGDIWFVLGFVPDSEDEDEDQHEYDVEPTTYLFGSSLRTRPFKGRC